MQLPLSTPDLLALIYFSAAWAGYARYARVRAKNPDTVSLSRSLRQHRKTWVARYLERDLRVTDASLLANQERVVGIFASTTLLLLAAVFTALANSELVAQIAAEVSFAETQSKDQVEMKLLVLAMILTFAFFKISWSLRQYGFVSVLMGSAPTHKQEITQEQREIIISSLAKLMDSAGHDNNSGLRAYYFAIALLCWQLGVVPFVVVTTVVVVVLYIREFKSAVVETIDRAHKGYPE